jgi:glycosyltransferase involved in cell wall biosynthesis
MIQPDVVHAHGAGVPGYLSLKSPYRVLVTFHGMLGEDSKYMSKLSDRIRLKFMSILCEGYCARNARHTVLISPYVEKHFNKRLRGQKHFIPNPVKDDFFNLRDSEEKNRILFAGKIIPRKGIDDLLKALVMVRDKANIKIILAGSLADKTYVNRLISHVAHLRLSGRVSFLGLLDENRLVAEFERCSLLVLPSYQETAPMVIQQAMAAGKPVVATNICGIPYQVVHGVTGFLYQPGDIEALSRHLVCLVKDEALRKRMGNKAKERALDSYRASAVATRTINVYRNIALCS